MHQRTRKIRKKTKRSSRKHNQETQMQSAVDMMALQNTTSDQLSAQDILQLQELYGNRAVQRMLAGEQLSVKHSGKTSTVQRESPAPAPTAENEKKGKSAYDQIQDYTEDVADEWVNTKDSFDTALANFFGRFTFATEDEAVPDITGALMKNVQEQITGAAMGKLETLVPGWSQVKSAVDSLAAEAERAAKAGTEVKLRDYMANLRTAMNTNYIEQKRHIRNGRDDLWKTYQSLPDDVKPDLLDSLPSWLEGVRKEIPTAVQYETEMYLQWVQMSKGMLDGFTQLGRIEIKYDAQEPNSYTFESATVRAPMPKKAASGLNWILSTPDSGYANVMQLPVEKMVGMYAENLIGGTGYGWAILDENNNVRQEPLSKVQKARWRAMDKSILEQIRKVSG